MANSGTKLLKDVAKTFRSSRHLIQRKAEILSSKLKTAQIMGKAFEYKSHCLLTLQLRILCSKNCVFTPIGFAIRIAVEQGCFVIKWHKFPRKNCLLTFCPLGKEKNYMVLVLCFYRTRALVWISYLFYLFFFTNKGNIDFVLNTRDIRRYDPKSP